MSALERHQIADFSAPMKSLGKKATVHKTPLKLCLSHAAKPHEKILILTLMFRHTQVAISAPKAFGVSADFSEAGVLFKE